MKIIRMHKQDFGKIRGFFDIEVSGFTIKGFKIIEHENNMFVSMPSQKNIKDEYNDTVYCAKELREKLNKMAIDHYNNIESKTTAPVTEDENLPF